jgi:hypothetical protein
VDHFLKKFNSYNRNIQFTIETETNNKIAFLDMLITRRSDQTLTTEFFSKAISNNVMVNYNSNHHIIHKMNVVRNLIHRVFKLDNKNSEATMRETIHKILSKNSYPKWFINTQIKKFKTKDSIRNQTTVMRPKRYMGLLYIKGITERATKFLKNQNDNLEIATYNTKQNRIFSNLKDPIEKESKRNIIYSIPCSECRASYIGQTKTTLKKRLQGHKSNINLVDKYPNPPTALCQHVKNTKHAFDLGKTKILHQCKKVGHLDFMEMTYINDDHNAVNRKQDCLKLSNTYSTILKLLKKRSNYIEPK